MSLDVYLEYPIPGVVDLSGRIFVREGGRRIELTRAEWDERYPGREPVTTTVHELTETTEVYTDNITHNLAPMARAAGLWEPMWRPDENGYETARQLIEPLTEGLRRLVDDPALYKEMNPENGWGDYDGFVEFVKRYLWACQAHPDAVVRASR